MDEREIAYEETGPLTVCPCCGGSAFGKIWACDACWDVHRRAFVVSGACGSDEAVERAWFYALGVRLRAEGKMPALAKAPHAKTAGFLDRLRSIPAVPTPETAPLIPDAPTLARLLFDSDPTIRAIIDRADDRGWHHYEREGAYAVPEAELLDRAWARETGVEAERRKWALNAAARVFSLAEFRRSPPTPLAELLREHGREMADWIAKEMKQGGRL